MDEYRGQYVVVGPPGTGKTTRIAASVERCLATGRRPVVLSLTRSAASEAAGRVSLPQDSVGTMHSFGWRLQERPSVVESDDVSGSWNEAHPEMALSPNLFGSLKSSEQDLLNVPQHDDDYLPGNAAYAKSQLYRHQMLPPAAWPDVTAYRFHTAWEAWKHETGLIDFTDMIDLAPDEPPEGANVLMADEAQDLSRLENHKLDRWAEVAGCAYRIGDPYQALYTWRGADPRRLSHPGNEVPESHRDVLRQSYRLSRAVHATATSWIRGIGDYVPFDFAPTPMTGRSSYLDASWVNADAVAQLAAEKASEQKRVMILTTCGYMLSHTLRCLKAMVTPFANPRRVYQGNWNPLGGRGTTMSRRVIALTAARRNGSGRWSHVDLYRWTAVLRADSALVRGAKSEIKKMADDNPSGSVSLYDFGRWIVPAKLAEFQVAYAGGDELLLGWWMKNLINVQTMRRAEYPAAIYLKHGLQGLTEPPNVWVGTCHSLKGAEADVVILFPDLSPKGHEAFSRGPGDEGHDSVIRTIYVGMTRARDELYLCRPASRKAVAGW